MLIASDRWREAYPGAVAGAVAVCGASHQLGHDGLRGFLHLLEFAPRERYSSGLEDEVSR